MGKTLLLQYSISTLVAFLHNLGYRIREKVMPINVIMYFLYFDMVIIGEYIFLSPIFILPEESTFSHAIKISEVVAGTKKSSLLKICTYSE